MNVLAARIGNAARPPRALRWNQVEAISQRFAQLNPYDHAAVPGSIPKIEDDNYDTKTGRQRQLWCLAISAKRYAVFVRDCKGAPAILRQKVNSKDDHYSEHGLGHLLNPIDPRSEDHDWIARVWLNLVRRSLGLRTQPLGFESRVAVGQASVTSPSLRKALKGVNIGKPYQEQVKPFNFVLSCHVQPLGHPIGGNPQKFHLIAPFERDPRQWEKMHWTDQYSGNTYRISTSASRNPKTTVRVKSYGDVLREYEFNPEAKYAVPTSKPCGRQTVGLLVRRRVTVESVSYIGKESNCIEEVTEQSLTDAVEVYTEYPDPRRDEWVTTIVPKLKAMPMRQLTVVTGMPRSTLQAIRAGRRPRKKTQVFLREIAALTIDSSCLS